MMTTLDNTVHKILQAGRPRHDRERARSVFYHVFGDSTNFMTPDTIDYGTAGDYAWELSRGTALLDPLRSIYGVTVITLTGDRTDLGAMFDTPEDALVYIETLTQ